MPDLNGSVAGGSAPVMRSEAGWRAIMADFRTSAMTRRSFRESRQPALETFRVRRKRLGRPAGKPSFACFAPPAGPGRDVGPEPGDGVILRLGRPVPGRPAGRRHPAEAEPADMRKSLDGLSPGPVPSGRESGLRPPARVRGPSPDHGQAARLRAWRRLHPGQAPG